MALREIRSRADQTALSNSLTEDMSFDSSQTGEFRHRTKDGALIDVRINSHSITFMHRPARVVLATDITDQKRAERDLRASEGRKHAILESALDGIIAIDSRARIIDF